MIVRQCTPVRVVVGADTRVLDLQVHRTKPSQSYLLPQPRLKLAKAHRQWELYPFAVEDDHLYFDVSDFSEIPKGLLKAELWAKDCLIDQLEIVKGASVYLSATTTDDACAEGCWDESCTIPRCEKTQTVACGCGCSICPASFTRVVVASINPMGGYS